MATPVVAGAWALLHSAMPSVSVNTWFAALKSTGTPIDGPIIQDMPRINVDSALQVELVVSGPYMPSRVSASWDGFEDFTLTWRAPTAGDAPTGYRISYNGLTQDVAPSVTRYSGPIGDLNLVASVAVIVGDQVGQPVSKIIAPIASNDSLVAAVASSNSKVLVSYSLGGDYCTSVSTPNIKVQYNSTTNDLRDLVLITGTGVAKTLTEQFITPPSGSGFTVARSRQITLTDPEAWLTAASKVFVANSSGMVGRALLLAEAFSGIQTAQRSPLAPTDLNVEPTFESALVSWSAGNSSSWKVFVDGVPSIVEATSLELDLAAGVHTVDVCAYSVNDSKVFSSTKVSKTFEVLPRINQTIRFANPNSVVLSATPINPAVDSDSGLGVNFQTLTPNVCTMDSLAGISTLTAGVCSIVFSQPGDAQYLAAEDVTLTFAVVRPTPLAIVKPTWKITNLVAKLSWGSPLNAALANVSGYVVQWRVALPKKPFSSWKSKTITNRVWTALKYKKFTRIQVKVYSVGEVGNSPVFTSTFTVK